MVRLNEQGAAAVKVDGHDAELVVHEEGISIDECWEEDGVIKTREHHWFGEDAPRRHAVLDRLHPDMGLVRLEFLGFETVERADQSA